MSRSPAPDPIKQYLSQIGRIGGSRSRRTLTKEQSREMLKVREARRAFKKFRALCFWSYASDLLITLDDVPWVAATLMKHGNREAWDTARKLCR
jgi:hypothetical protein